MSRAAVSTAVRRACTGVGSAGVVAGCVGMVAMLPETVAGALGAIGLGSSSILARTLSPVAEPLYVASAVLVVLGALACSRLVALASVGAGTLLYLSMFRLASGGAGVASSTAMAAMRGRPAASPHAEPVTFYLGLACLLVAVGLSGWRHHRLACRPLLRLARPSITLG